MASENLFKYGPPLQDRNIRFVKISPSPDKTMPEINLEEHRLGNVRFEANSYVWGKQTATMEVRCNGRMMSVGANLLDIIGELTGRQSKDFFWIDASLINQKDQDEKTRQVRMIRDIYAKAGRVIIWLGRELAADRKGLELAKKLYRICDGAH